MNKQFLIKTLTTVGIILVSAIAVLAVVLFFAAETDTIKGLAVGLGAGAIIGGLIKCLVIIPKKYNDKDERTLLVTLLTNTISQSVFGIVSYLCLMFVLTDVIDINSFDIRFISMFAGIVVLLTFASNKIVYKIIDSKL